MSTNSTARGFRPRPRGGVGFSGYVLLCILVAVPAYALNQLTAWIDWRVLLGAPVALSVFTFFIYRADKRRAEAGAGRVPESALHLAEFLGGWPGAFLAQRMFRHKIVKTSYQVVFWTVVLLHELVAADSLAGWRITSDVFRFVGS